MKKLLFKQTKILIYALYVIASVFKKILMIKILKLKKESISYASAINIKVKKNLKLKKNIVVYKYIEQYI